MALDKAIEVGNKGWVKILPDEPDPDERCTKCGHPWESHAWEVYTGCLDCDCRYYCRDYDALAAAAQVAGTVTCSCGFVYYRTTDTCPKCSRPALDRFSDKSLLEEVWRRNHITVEVEQYNGKVSYQLTNTAGYPDKVGGYCGFYMVMEFNEDGSLATIGAWE